MYQDSKTSADLGTADRLTTVSIQLTWLTKRATADDKFSDVHISHPRL